MIHLEEMSILIVDDFESMCKSIRGMLKVLKFGKKFRTRAETMIKVNYFFRRTSRRCVPEAPAFFRTMTFRTVSLPAEPGRGERDFPSKFRC
jgi:hypothetical protein